MAQTRHFRSPVGHTALSIAFEVFTRVHRDDAFCNLALDEVLSMHPDASSVAAEATELTYGASRLRGTHDLIIEAATGRPLKALQPAVLDLLRLTSHRLLAMRTPDHVAVHTGVEFAKQTINPRVGGLVNAAARRISERSMTAWLDHLAAGRSALDALAIRTHHPRWIAEAYLDLLGDEAEAALLANNQPAAPVGVVRPGLVDRQQLADTSPTRWSPWGFTSGYRPNQIAAVRDGRAGVQDEGSQLVAGALAATAGELSEPWLDLCAGPGGKAALLAGLARQRGRRLVASEVAPHRARLVAQGLRAYPDGVQVICADGTEPAWNAGTFAVVMADVPCSGLGSLRRRPDARWRKDTADLDGLSELQFRLAVVAAESLVPGGVMAYVTCSPHRRETLDVVDELLDYRRDLDLLDAPAALASLSPDDPITDTVIAQHPKLAQLWPHRHGTDAMFLALLGRRASSR